MTLSEQQRKFSLMVGKLIVWTYQQGYELALGEVKRPIAMQKIYYDSGRSKTMKSKHLDCLAIDLALFKQGKYLTKADDYVLLGEYWESIGGRWGGRFGDNLKTKLIEGWDPYHFQYGE